MNIHSVPLDMRVDWYRKKLRELVHEAFKDGVVLTAETKPLERLAMGHYTIECEARPMRGVTE